MIVVVKEAKYKCYNYNLCTYTVCYVRTCVYVLVGLRTSYPIMQLGLQKFDKFSHLCKPVSYQAFTSTAVS